MPSEHPTAKTIFLQAIEEYASEQWPQFITEACGEDWELRREVEFLLHSHQRAGEFLQHGTFELEETAESERSEKIGSEIGPYKLLQRLGEGGMGEVYMAEQSAPVKRRVAVKVIKAGMDSRQVIARFEAERQALAMMDHPNVAKVLDAGTTDSGHPYFVMELVKGVSITDFCDEHQLELRDRLALFRDTCLAVQHAHQKGIIHRDIKPSNVLVAQYDDVAVPKIIDFGVAKATQQGLTEKTMFTEIGTVIGTVEYMSPEQAKLNQLDIDTRSDIYSLGVLLYELLIGDTPYDRQKLRSAALDEMLRIVREEEPSRPSLKLGSSKSLPAIAAKRHVEPQKLGMLLRGELDWIVMKALHKDRSRRYDTAVAFANDVQRYLDDEPIQARPPSIGYRLTKAATRHRRFVPLIVALCLAFASLFWLAVVEYQRRGKESKYVAELAIAKCLDLAREYETNQKFEQAREQYEQAVELLKRRSDGTDRRLDKAEVRLARMQTLSGDFAAAIEIYENRLASSDTQDLNPEGREIAATLFEAYVARTKQLATTSATEKEARASQQIGKRAVNLALKYGMSPTAAWLALVESHYRCGEYRQALSYATTYLESGTGDYEYPFYLWFAVLHSRLDETQMAKDWFVVASGLWPGVPGRNQYQELRELAAELVLGSPDAIAVTATTRAREQAFSRVIEIYRRCPNFRRSRGYVRFQLGDWDLAAEDFELAAKRTKYWSPVYHACTALMSRLQGKRDSYLAIREDLFDRLKSGLVRNDDETVLILALYLIQRDNVDLDVIASFENKSNVMDGVAQYRAGDYTRAASLLKSADSDAIGTYATLFLAMTYQQMGQVEDARSMLQRARMSMLTSCALPGRPQPSQFSSYFTTTLWCAPLAVLPEAEKLIDGDLSPLGNAVQTGDYAAFAAAESEPVLEERHQLAE